MKTDINTDEIKHLYQRLLFATATFIKWLLCSLAAGVIIGLIGTLFYRWLSIAASFRESHPYMLFFLPVAGIVIVFLYRRFGEGDNTGTNLVITAIHSNDKVPVKVTPLIIVSTVLTHLCGGSAGREGAALQVGGSIGNFFADLMNFDDKDTRIMIMCGMSACFSALFGTPVAAAIFSMEVVSVGVMYYAALVPCVISAYTAQGISEMFHITHSEYVIDDIPALNLVNGTKFLVIAIFFALASILLCVVLHKVSKLYGKYFENPYVRVVFAGLFVIALRYIFGTTDFLGAGTAVIEKSFTVRCAWYVFLLKMIFTAFTLGGGFKGGEIVPTLFVGATLGSFLSGIFGLPIAICAACGMVSVFCGVTNCPITSLILAVEMFHMVGLEYCMLCIAVSYLLSGYYSLYNSQKIVYSKYRTEYINRNTH
jgi:H+/Cl- antiporter ClcA